MRLVLVGSALWASGCLSLDKFDKKYQDKYCEEWSACGGKGTCPFEEQEAAGLDFGPTCADENAYNKDAAKDCLDAEWECNDEVPGFETPLVPEVCLEACGEAAT